MLDFQFRHLLTRRSEPVNTVEAAVETAVVAADTRRQSDQRNPPFSTADVDAVSVAQSVLAYRGLRSLAP